MDWNWLHSLIYGILGGFFEFLPVPSDAQQSLMVKLSGVTDASSSLRLAVHLGCLLAVIFMYYNRIVRLRRENRIAALPVRRRKRQPDVACLMELRLLRIGMLPVVVSAIVAPLLSCFFGRVWMLAIILFLNGVLILLPQYLPGSNKDARSLSPLDALLIGLGGVLGTVPGISRVGMMIGAAKIRGSDQQFAVHFTYLLLIPTLIAMCVADVVLLVMAGVSIFSAWMFLHGLLVLISAAASAVAGIYFMRFLSVNIGFSGFAYYSIGLAMFTFVLYLIG